MSRKEIIAACVIVVAAIAFAIVVFGGGDDKSSSSSSQTTEASTPTDTGASTTAPEEPKSGATGPKIDTSKPAVKPPGKGPGLYTFFNADKENIGCAVTHVKARCEILKFDWKAPPKPSDCAYNYGGSITVFPSADAEFGCEIDTVLGTPASTLGSGDYYTNGPFICSVQNGGVVCKSLKTGHGFLISRKRYQLF